MGVFIPFAVKCDAAVGSEAARFNVKASSGDSHSGLRARLSLIHTCSSVSLADSEIISCKKKAPSSLRSDTDSFSFSPRVSFLLPADLPEELYLSLPFDAGLTPEPLFLCSGTASLNADGNLPGSPRSVQVE